MINVKGVGFNLHHGVVGDDGISFSEKEVNVINCGEV